ncbi:MAG: hypothetical protein ACYCS9_10740 [Candidatus Dormibacteria bacterium]
MATMTRPPSAPSPMRCSPATILCCSPQRLPADTAGKRLVDRLLPTSAVGVGLYFAAVAGLLMLATALPLRWQLVLDALAALLGGGWCALNFWRCRHAHCLVTGAGWLVLGVFALAEAGTGRSLIRGYEEGVFLGVLAAGIMFEWLWSRSRGTHAVMRPSGAGSGAPPQ